MNRARSSRKSNTRWAIGSGRPSVPSRRCTDPAATERGWTSEDVPYAQLHDTPVLRGGDFAERRRANLIARLIEPDLVEEVEDLEPQLQPLTANGIDVLEQGQVGFAEAGAAHRVARLAARSRPCRCHRT